MNGKKLEEVKEEIDRVCIIGLDALEHDLVEEWNLEELKQEEYGKIDLPVDSKNVFTPVIWTSFITGKLPEEHGINSDRKWSSGFLNSLGNLKKKMVRDFGLDIFPSWMNHNLADGIGFEVRPIRREDHGLDTIFDLFGNTVAISIPGYNIDEDGLEVRNLCTAGRKGGGRGKAKERALELFEKRKSEALEKIGGQWKVFMVYFYYLDILQHIFYYDEEFIKEMYAKASDFVKKLKERIDDKTLFLIVADHGMKDGKHSNYGFYSTNKKLNLGKTELTSFFPLINKLLGGPKREKEEEIKKHLEELGYKV